MQRCRWWSAPPTRGRRSPAPNCSPARSSGGDSYVAYRSAGTATVLTDDRIDRLNLPQARRYRERLAADAGYDATHAAILRELQAGQLERRNTPGGYWIASADPTAAAHAITRTIPAASLEWIILATDGAVETARHLGLADWQAIADCDQAGLSALLRSCHEWEQGADPGGWQLPRAKRHDDKAIATMRFLSDQSHAQVPDGTAHFCWRSGSRYHPDCDPHDFDHINSMLTTNSLTHLVAFRKRKS